MTHFRGLLGHENVAIALSSTEMGKASRDYRGPFLTSVKGRKVRRHYYNLYQSVELGELHVLMAGAKNSM